MAFYTGQKVVCVDDSPSHWGDPSMLKKNSIYTILKVVNHGHGVWLVEVGHTRGEFEYAGFRANRFRPAVDTKTDISVFQKELNPKKVKELT